MTYDRRPGASSSGSSGATANIVSATQTADFSQAGAQTNFQLGTIAPTITLAAGSDLLILVAGHVSSNTDPSWEVRLNIDSGATIVQLGRQACNALGFNLAASALVSGLSAGDHTVKYEYTKAGTGTIFLRGAAQPQLERLSIILEEKP